MKSHDHGYVGSEKVQAMRLFAWPNRGDTERLGGRKERREATQKTSSGKPWTPSEKPWRALRSNPSQSRSGSRRPLSFAPRYWQTVSQNERPSSQKSRGSVVAWIRRSSWVGSVRSALTQSATR